MREAMLQRIFYGALGVLALAGFGVALAAAGAEGLAFALFALLTLGGALMCLWERSVVRSAFSLMATFTGIAGFFLLLEADFLAMAQILIYVGGILALLLFAVMLTPPDLGERRLSRIFASLLLAGGGTLWLSIEVARNARWVVLGSPLDGRAQGSSAERIGVGFLAPDQYLVAFELAAVLLTVALVAAVYIARRRKADYQPGKEAL